MSIINPVINSEQPSPLLNAIPSEIVQKVATFLPKIDILHLGITCQELHGRVLSEDAEPWKEMLKLSGLSGIAGLSPKETVKYERLIKGIKSYLDKEEITCEYSMKALLSTDEILSMYEYWIPEREINENKLLRGIVKSGNVELCAALYNNGKIREVFPEIVKKGDLELVKRFLKNIDPLLHKSCIDKGLSVAAENGFLNIAGELLKCPNLNPEDRARAIIKIANEGSLSDVEELLKDVSTAHLKIGLVLSLATEEKNWFFVQFLVQKFVFKSKKLFRLSLSALRSENPALCKTLLEKVNELTSEEMKSFLHTAVVNQKPFVIQWFFEKYKVPYEVYDAVYTSAKRSLGFFSNMVQFLEEWIGAKYKERA